MKIAFFSTGNVDGLKTLYFVFLLFFGTYAYGVNNVDQNMDVLEITGTLIKDETSLQNVPAYSISRQEILQISPGNVVDLLRTIPGVNVTQQGGSGGLSFISLRGGEPNFTVVILDGVKVNDITNSRGGGFDFVGLDPLLIQSIEIYFGGLSPVFGSDALGGVISIITLEEEFSTKEIAIERGSHSQYAGSFHVAGRSDTDLVANLSGAYRDGGDAVEGDTLQRKQVSAKFNSVADGNLDWKLNLFSSTGDSSSYPEDSGGDQFAIIRQEEAREFKQNNLAASIAHEINEVWHVSLNSSFTRHDEDIKNPGIAPGVLMAVPPVTSDSQYTRTDLNLVNTFNLNDKTKIAAGAEFSREEGDFDSIIDFGFPVIANFEIDRESHSFFSEISYQVLDNLGVTAGVRYDDADGIEETTFRFASNYRTDVTGTEFIFQYGEGFKLPSFFALGHPLVGNPNLEPEFSKNTVLTIKQGFFENRLMITGSYFYNRFTNLVDFDPLLFTNVNRSKVIAKGGEIQASYAPSNSVKISTFLTSSDYEANSGVTLRRRPEWTGGLSLFWQTSDRFSLNFQASYVDEFFDSSIPTGLIELDSYTSVDAAFAWKLTSATRLKIAIYNIFDKDFEETVGFSNPGRELRLKLTIDL